MIRIQDRIGRRKANRKSQGYLVSTAEQENINYLSAKNYMYNFMLHDYDKE